MALDLYFKNSVGPSFNGALASLDSFVSTIRSCDISRESKFMKIVPQLRHDIRDVYEQIEEANTISSNIVRQFNEQLEDLVREEGNLMYEKRSKEEGVAELRNAISGLKAEKTDLEKSVKDSRKQEREANKLLETARNELQAKRTEQNIVRGVGIGLFAIPVAGWIAGSALVAVSFTALEENVQRAEKARDSANDHVNSTQRQLNHNVKQLNDNKELMKIKKQELSEIDQRLNDIKQKLKDQRRQVKVQAELNDKIKQCCHFVSVCFGRTEVLEFQSRHLFCFEQLILPLRELSYHLLGSPPDTLQVYTRRL
ncbi:uncharacterized protein LOC143257393 [Tachypleus tridentatus]|uniref:uncharacterized protein LOC143257393 n=1 Tax=Tachypleus tridentatus TaxID=6853 RepID=UPI003FD3304E